MSLITCALLIGTVQSSTFVDVLTLGRDANKYNGEFVDVGETEFNRIFRDESIEKIIKRECSGCRSTHQEIFYKRLTDLDTFNVYNVMKDTWVSTDNLLNTDFELYSTLSDALAGTNRWNYCNYDDYGVGPFRDCGQTGYVPCEWTADVYHARWNWHARAPTCANDAKFSIYVATESPTTAQPTTATPTTASPTSALSNCPAGTIQIGSRGADISGCGLQSCPDRYDLSNIEECADRCRSTSGCVAITWADLNGDSNHVDKLVCTLYSSATPTHVWGTTQVFCDVIDTTTTTTPAPTTAEPTTAEPTERPTTSEPTTAQPTTASPTECISYRDYEYVGTASSVNNARALCEAIGSTLATIVNDDDVATYRARWEEQGLPYTGTWNGDGQSAIGLGDSINEGTYLWDDGTPCELNTGLCFDYWGNGEPNESGPEDCVTFSFPSSTDGTITYANDKGCDSQDWPNGLYVFCNEDPCNPYTPSPTECNGGYEYVGQASTVNNARTLCENIGSTLATVNSDNDVEIYRQALEDEGVPQTGSFNGLGQTAIGLGDRGNEGVYVWDDGTECKLNDDLCYDYWGSGEPNDSGGEDCVTFSFPSDSTTYSNDIDCDSSFGNKLFVFCNVECDDDCPTDGFIYVETPLPYEEARQYCRDTYGTTLATISNDEQIEDAVALIGDEIAWFGLYSRSTGGNWKFLNRDPCTAVDSVYKCIDFWDYRLNKNAKYRPRCIGDKEGGYQCANFDGDEETADNDIDCEMALPFLCDSCEATTSGTTTTNPPF